MDPLPGRPASTETMKKKILVIDVGGTHVKLMISREKKRKFKSGPKMTPREMVGQIKAKLKEWEREVMFAVGQLKKSLIADYLVLGGGNAKELSERPVGAELGHNRNAFLGGVRLWQTDPRSRRPKWRIL